MTFINLLVVLQPDRCIHCIVQKNCFSFLSPRTLQSGIVKFVSKVRSGTLFIETGTASNASETYSRRHCKAAEK